MKGFRTGMFFLVVVCVTLVWGSCARKAGTEAAPAESVGPGETGDPAEAFAGIVTFTTGPVSLDSKGESRTIDVGERVVEGDVVTTGADATCEIQFGSFGSVHVASGTSLDVSRLSRDAGVTKSELLLGAGTVICKVRKLSGDDSFVIRTSTLVCGVRGTVFLVSHQEGKKTKVAVETGRVAVAAGSASAGSDAASADPDPAASTEALVVEAGFESVVKAEGAGKPLAESAPPVPIAEETKREFSAAPTPEIRNLGGEEPEAKGADAKPVSLPALRVVAEPKTAVVAINGKPVSRGRFTALYSKGETVLLSVREEGFETHEEAIVMGDGNDVVREVSLKVLGSKPQSADSADTSKQPAPPRDPLETFVVPATGKKAKFAVANGSGRTLLSDESSVLSCLDGKGAVLWTAETGNGPNVNSVPVLEGKYAAYAGDKALAVFDAASGKQLWSLRLDASSSALFGRRPAISGGTLFLGTGSGISAFNAADGTPSGTVAIPDGTEMTPACQGDFLYVVSRSGAFVEIDIQTMTVKRRLATGAVQPIATSVTVAGNLALFGDRKGTVTAVNLKDFSVAWQRRLSEDRGYEVYGDIVASRELAFVVARDTLYALSLSNGSPASAPVSGVISPVVAAPDAVWCAHSSRKLYGFSRLDASRVAEQPVPGGLSSGVAFNGDRLVAPLSDGRAAFIAPR